MRRPANKAFLGSLLLFLLVSPFAAPATADWLRSLANAPQKKYADDVNAVVLLEETETTVRDNGDIVTHGRIAYRILRPEGRDYALFGLAFDNETKITYLHGWSITTKGLEYEAKEKDAFERNISTFEIFSDDKEKLLSLPGADVGTVVGFEFERKLRPFLFDQPWYIQKTIPVERSRYILRVPAGWEYRADWINHPKLDAVEQNGAYVWELSDVPRVEREHREPPYHAVAATMLVRFFSDRVKDQTFNSWNDLGRWESQLTAGTRTASPALQQKVHELAPASLPIFDRIKALATFAQRDVRYAAIEVGIGGFKPHPASEIFAHRYGDCKDKATVLSAMLAEIGVKSFYMPIHDERGIVTDKTPPSQRFNHVILAIQLPDAAYGKPLPAVYEHPKLGHLLLFDPTNDVVPLGQLPHYEQDSYALLVTGEGGELIHLPVTAPEANKVTSTARVKLLPDGTLQGEVEEVSTGYRAALKRGLLKDQTEKDRRKILELILGSTLGSLQVDDFSVTNADDLDKDFILRYKFTASHYAKNAGTLLLVRPHVVGEFAGYLDASKPRHYPYEINAPFYNNETVEITLPDGYRVDELPEPAGTTVPFAEYSSKTENSGGVLKYTREYKMQTTLVPVEKIDQLKTLFGAINLDEKNMAILKKAN